MIVRSLGEVLGTDRDVNWGNGQSRRLLLEGDSMGFAVCDPFVKAGTASLLEYKNHLEACYCIEGFGEVEEMSGTVHKLFPGVLYALNKHDKHILRGTTDMRVISIFNPPIKGSERHVLGEGGGSTY